MAAASLRTPAWLLRGISSVPGELALQGGVLRFTARGSGSAWPFQLRRLERALGAPGLAQALAEGRPFQCFQWPRTECRAWLPWHYFGGGLKLERQAQVLRFSFARPGNEEAVPSLASLGPMRKRGQQWLAALHATNNRPGQGQP